MGRGIDPEFYDYDRDPVFTTAFWKELMALTGSKLHMTTAFHPQADGQAEAANKVIVMYLRCFTGDRPRQWLCWLLWAEYTFNTAYQLSLKDTAFRMVYGRDPPSLRSYEPGASRVVAVAKNLEERDEFLADVCYRLELAQAIAKRQYDKHYRPVHYAVGDWVWLRVRHRTPMSLPSSVKGKLRLMLDYYGPYQISQKINDVAFRLALPEGAAFIMFSMSAYSRNLWVRHHWFLLPCRQCIMVQLFQLLPRL
jgi:hypothetical protein